MSYCAGGDGRVVLEKRSYVNYVIALLSKAFENVWVVDDDTVGFVRYRGIYCEKDILECLDGIVPFIKEGSIEFSGEDDCLWCFKFADGKWVDLNGTVIYGYDLSDVPDDNLIAEVKKRGLVI